MKIDFDLENTDKTTPGKPKNKILDGIYLDVPELLKYLDLDERLKIIFPDFTDENPSTPPLMKGQQIP